MISESRDLQVVDAAAKGDIVIKRNLQYNHLEADTVIVEENRTARIYGIIRRMVVLEKGSRLFLHGKIYGSVVNRGGELRVYSA